MKMKDIHKLIKYCELGKADKLALYIDTHKSIDLNYDDGLFAFVAARGGKLEVLKILNEKGADLHVNDESILAIAARYGQLSCVRFLLENEADPSKLKDSTSFNSYLNIENFIIQEILKGKEFVDIARGLAPIVDPLIMEAIDFYKVKKIMKGLDYAQKRGMFENLKEWDYPYHKHKEQLNKLKVKIEESSKINTEESNIQKPQYLNSLYKQIKSLYDEFNELDEVNEIEEKLSEIKNPNNKEGYILNKKDNQSMLHIAVQISQENEVEKILNECPKLVSVIDKYGQTPLHWAASKGNYEITKLLIDKMTPEEIAKQAEGNHNYTALHLAVHSENKEIVKEIIEALKDHSKLINIKDVYGQTPLHWAISKSCYEVIKLIINSLHKSSSDNEIYNDYTISDWVKGTVYYDVVDMLKNNELQDKSSESPSRNYYTNYEADSAIIGEHYSQVIND
jgi:ankyrin repeat protein